jgi:tetratricopeptide (TPR) repeat protein
MPSRSRFSIGALAPLLIALAGAAVYANSLSGAFVYDDSRWIQSDRTIRSFDRLPSLLAGATRPIWKLSFAANYAVGGLDVTGYHVVNGVIHLLAGITLLGVCRRTLRRSPLPQRYREAADGIAFSIALLWTLHPLQTQAVTYVVQRCESGMGLCLLASVYASIRGFETSGGRSRLWSALAVVTCGIGMGTKEVMVVAPVVVWLHDRSFLSGSGPAALRGRPGLYAGLAACWAIPFGVIGVDALFAGEMARPDLETVSRLDYALTQPAILLHYVRLVLWPDPLIFAYGWPAAERWSDILPALLVVSAAAAAGAWAVWRNRPWGFVAAWFFAILAPTSSIQPIQDLAVEHRMYLPLAAVAVAVVLAVFEVARKAGTPRAAPALLIVAALVLGGLTIRRNRDYQSGLRLWETVTLAAPDFAIGHYNYGTGLRGARRNEEAIASFRRAIALDPSLVDAHNNLGNAILDVEGLEAAIPHYREAIALDPTHAEAHYNLARVLFQLGDAQTAAAHFRRAIESRPGYANAEYGLGVVLENSGDNEGALAAYRAALVSNPRLASAHLNAGRLLHARGDDDEAETHLLTALQLRPRDARTWRNASTLRADQGRIEEAIDLLRHSISLEPDYAPARARLEELLARRDQAGTTPSDIAR